MNNNKPFDSHYIEITLPLSDAGIALLEERKPDALNEYRNFMNNKNVTGVFCELTVAFDTVNSTVLFMLNTIAFYDDEDYPIDTTETYIYLDSETADYFKAEALAKLMYNAEIMNDCKTETA